MGITYRNVKWLFDKTLWTLVVSALCAEYGEDDMAELLDVKQGTLESWWRGIFDKEFPHPALSNLLKVANLLDTDPADFLIMEK